MINELLNIKYPIIQGGMAKVATGEFAAAISNARALGTIGSGGMTAEILQKHIHMAKANTDKPFAVNIMLMNPDSDNIAQLCIDEKVPVITTGAGNPGVYIDKWKDAGIKVFPVVASVALAKRLSSLGVDGLIAEGCESGGHVGELTTMVLLPQVCNAVNIPVIAAGGIACGRQMKAAIILGAQGVQIGTSLLASDECPIHENYKDAVIKAKDLSTIVTGRIAGTPVRVLKNPMSREYVKREKEGADVMELENFTLGSLTKAVINGDIKNGSLMAGQVSSMVKKKRPAREIIEEIMNEFNAIK